MTTTNERNTADLSHEALYADGKWDASLGAFPSMKHPSYLAGYIAAIQEMPTNEFGRIIRPAPEQHFAFGYYDSPDEF